MPCTGKACVVDFMGNAGFEGGRKIGFNKMSGILEFKDVIVLWVNMGGKNNDYDNEVSKLGALRDGVATIGLTGGLFFTQFYDGGREVSWFGGSRMHKETPIIKKLVKWSRQKQTSQIHDLNDSGGSQAVVMWCRFVDGSNTEPYYFMGRCGYVTHDEDTHPIPFRFKLVDYDRIKTGEKFCSFANFK